VNDLRGDRPRPLVSLLYLFVPGLSVVCNNINILHLFTAPFIDVTVMIYILNLGHMGVMPLQLLTREFKVGKFIGDSENIPGVVKYRDPCFNIAG
jgi:hypothetical protein